MLTTTIAADIEGRRAAALGAVEPPSGRARTQAFQTQLRSSLVERDGKQFLQLEGTPSVVDKTYEMWDFFGPYEEKIVGGAFDKTLAADPDVQFLVNHKGLAMARTKAKTLELGIGMAGNLEMRAWLNPQRQDVTDLRHAIDDGAVTEMSFAFRIVDWEWNDDYSLFTIREVDLERGDVSAVNYGANPHTSISARDTLAALEHLQGAALHAARERIAARTADEAKGEPLDVARFRQSLAD